MMPCTTEQANFIVRSTLMQKLDLVGQDRVNLVKKISVVTF